MTWLSAVVVLGCGASKTTPSNDSIVSTTLCADTYLLKMQDIEPRLAALSWQSRSSLSNASKTLRALPQADNDPERLRKWNGSTIISSAGGKGHIDLAWGEDFDTVWKNFGTLSKSLQLPDPSETLKTRLSNIPSLKRPLKLLYLDRSGATAGPGTFVHAVMTATGAENIIRNEGWQSPDTETLLHLKPDVIVMSFIDSNYSSVNDRVVRHAALADKIESLPQVDIPGGLWPCAGPGLVEAAEHLSSKLALL